MSSAIHSAAAILIFITVCLLQWTSVTMTADDLGSPRSDFLFRYLREQREKPRELGMFKFQCSYESDSCIPGTQHCCEGMMCRNKFRHICLYPLESCFCTVRKPKYMSTTGLH